MSARNDALQAWSVATMREFARRRLPRPLFDFIDGAAEDEGTLRANEADFDDWAVLPRPLDGAGTRDLSITLFGHRLASPVLIGPTGLAGLFWPRGEVAAARLVECFQLRRELEREAVLARRQRRRRRRPCRVRHRHRLDRLCRVHRRRVRGRPVPARVIRHDTEVRVDAGGEAGDDVEEGGAINGRRGRRCV
jgi:hypothetical protein